MRSTLEIEIAVSECKPVTEEELKYALIALGHMHAQIRSQMYKMVESARAHKTPPHVLAQVNIEWDVLERMFQARKVPVDNWLGDHTPGHPEQQKWLRIGKAIFKKVMGQDLET